MSIYYEQIPFICFKVSLDLPEEGFTKTKLMPLIQNDKVVFFSTIYMASYARLQSYWGTRKSTCLMFIV